MNLTFGQSYQRLSEQPQPFNINISLEDGLPSEEAYHVFESSTNDIWIATDAGVFKYGLRGNKLFTLSDGLTDQTVFKFFEDPKGRIWCSTFNHALFYIQNDSVFEYEYNHLIAQNIPPVDIILGLVMDSQDCLHLGLSYSGYYTIDRNGEIDHFDIEEPREDEQIGLYLKPIEDHVITFRDKKSREFTKSYQHFPAWLRVLEKNTNQEQIKLRAYSDMFNEGGVDYGCRIDGSSFGMIFRGDPIVVDANQSHQLDANGAPAIYITSFDNHIWVGTKRNGLFKFNMDYELVAQYLDGSSVSSICQDFEGSLWLSTLEFGVFYIPSESVVSVPNSAEGNALTLTSSPQGTVFVGHASGELYEYYAKETLSKSSLVHPSAKRPIYDLTYHNDTLYCATPLGNRILDYHSPVKFIKAKLLCSHANGNLYSINQTNISINGQRIIRHTLKVNCVTECDEGILLGCSNGLWRFDGENLEQLDIKGISNTNITNIIKHGPRHYFTTLGGSIYKMEGYDNIEQLDLNIQPESIYDLEVFNDQLWMSWDQGVMCFHLNDSKEIQTHVKAAGLPDGRIRQLAFSDDKLWLLTLRGLSYMENELQEPMVPVVEFCEVQVNNEIVDTHHNLSLGPRSNELEISLCGLSYRNQQNLTYRYFLDGIDQDTVYSSSGDIRYPQIPSGEHTFYASVSFDRINYSEPISFEVEVSSPFWSSWQFFAILTGIAMAISYISFQVLSKRRERETNVKRQLIELRSSALRSQMNPHFTHNALNSIQSLIASKQNKEASIYLAEFAQLMRRNLNASSIEMHSLKKELEIVESYQKLEKLRFKEDVEFEIEVDPKLDPNSIMMPSMMIQPLVENSLIHGILPKTGAGKISTKVELNSNNMLFIVVEDNGVGIQRKSQKSVEDSKALSILEERIRLIDEQNSLSTISPTFVEGGFRNELKIQLK
ncbi:MAG: histidine kinase [Flavobacteriales bacterium]|nr:histidine kinase [Flavobacteriales bacterium]